ncbi:hypothetical protein C8R43DRAFT_1228863 [Mycena crocata]|nr:hypothetical protein C8R43DRAFT_1228863 [Mycena crocata]
MNATIPASTTTVKTGTISKVPYPGNGHASGQKMGMWIHTSSDPGNVTEVFELIMSRDSRLRDILSVVAGYDTEASNYNDAELWYMGSWHTSDSDPTDHCTFRLFRAVSTGKPFNEMSFHLYRNGTSHLWMH